MLGFLNEAAQNTSLVKLRLVNGQYIVGRIESAGSETTVIREVVRRGAAPATLEASANPLHIRTGDVIAARRAAVSEAESIVGRWY